MKKCCQFFVNNMGIFVVLIGVLGALHPQLLTWVGPYIPWLLGIVMFGMGMTLTVEDFKAVGRRPWEVLIGAAAQFVIMPCVAWALVKLFALPPELAIGVILVGTCPGGTASNVISYLAKGDVALSVSMTMASTILAPLVTPALTWFIAGAWIEVSFFSMMISIAEMVLLPVVLGVLFNRYCHTAVTKVMPAMPVISVFTIVLLVGGVVALGAGKLFDVGLMMAGIVILHNCFGLALGYGMAKICHLNSKKARTVSIEVGMQNSGMAASLAVMYFNPAAAIPGAIFSVWQNISGSLVANFFAHHDEKLEAHKEKDLHAMPSK